MTYSGLSARFTRLDYRRRKNAARQEDCIKLNKAFILLLQRKIYFFFDKLGQMLFKDLPVNRG